VRVSMSVVNRGVETCISPRKRSTVCRWEPDHVSSHVLGHWSWETIREAMRLIRVAWGDEPTRFDENQMRCTFDEKMTAPFLQSFESGLTD
jgi:hypothetical protein